MPRRPAADEREIIPARSGKPEARVYVHELAAFLNEPRRVLLDYARKRGFLYRARYHSSFTATHYVSEYGAMRLIAYVRARQGEQYMGGKNTLELREADALRKRLARSKARMVNAPDGAKREG